MIGTYLIRGVGVLTCVAVVASGWDAEAGWRRHHHRRAASCCEPVCCEPVREVVCCAPQREIVIMPMAPVATCCNNQVVSTEAARSEAMSVMKRAPAQGTTAGQGTKATAASLQR